MRSGVHISTSASGREPVPPRGLVAALLLGACGACTSPVPGTAWSSMDAGTDTENAGTGDLDVDSDVDVDGDADSDSDSDADSETDADIDGGSDDAGPAWRFAVFADNQGTVAEDEPQDQILGTIASAVLADGVDLVIYPGDLVSGTSVPESLEAQLLAWRDIM